MRQGHTAPAIATAAIVLAALAAACLSDRSTAAGTSGTVTCTTPSSTAGAAIVFISNFTFLPPTVHVKAGQSVAWVNCEPDTTPHTATSDGGSFDSGSLVTPDAYVRSFPAAGTFPYHCTIHPGMKATVIVE
jgi:plastocyanin